MDATWLISGAGGGGGGGGKGGGGGSSPQQYTPSESKDNLNSTAYATVLDLLGEGEIEGFATPSRLGISRDTDSYNIALLKDIYFNNTPLLRSVASNTAPTSADYNFKDVAIATRYGTQLQDYIPGFSSAENEVPVNTAVLNGTPITKTVTDTDVDAVRVTITVPALQQIKDNGDIVGASIRLQIAVQYNGGGYTVKIDDTITGRTADQYQRDYVVSLDGAFPVDVRVIRVTADSTSAKLTNAFSWTSYTEITYAKLRYPNSALVGLRVDAKQFNSIPSRSYRVRGLKVPIPSNATVDLDNGRLIYSGIWNGSFGAAQWTSDPAWCLYALLTNKRWGFGDHINADTLDKWAFYECSVYCSELVPDGLGNVEPRFSCNCNIQTSEEAFKLISDLASTMRAMPYWAVGTLTLAQDRPQDPAYLFTLANVTEAGFSYSGSSLKTRHTVVSVKYLDLESRDVAYEVVEAPDLIAKYGVIRSDIDGFACTSRGQARRLGEWLLYSEANETEIVSFTASIDAGVLVRPGQVIQVADPMKSGARRAGRISAATIQSITVDNTSATDLSVGPNCTVSIVLPDGSVETRGVASIVGNIITTQIAFSSAPIANSIWMLSDDDLSPTTWRVLSVQEQDQATYAITALAHNPSKYAYIEQDKPLQAKNITALNIIPNAPTNLSAEEVFYVVGSRVQTKILCAFTPVKGVSTYRVRYRAENNNWTVFNVYGPSFDILEAQVGTYQIEVYSLSSTEILSSEPATLQYAAQGTSAPPADVTGISLTPINDTTAIISWDLATDLDVLIGGKVLIRHDPTIGAGAQWTNANPIVQSAAGNQTQKQVPLLDGTYFLKFEDQGGRRSVTAASVSASSPSPQPRLTVKTWSEESLSPKFPGTATNMVYSPFYAGLALNYFNTLDAGTASTNYTALDTRDGGTAATDYTALDSLQGGNADASNFTTDVTQTGDYIFLDTLDLGAVYDLNLTRRIVSTPYGFGTLWDDITSDIDTLTDIDGSVLDVTTCDLYVRSTTGNPSGSPTWSSWNEITNGIVRGRGFQLKLTAASGSPSVLVAVSQLGATAQLQQRVEQSATITSGAGTYTATFASAFYQPPAVSITPLNMATGDYFTLGTPTRTGFTVTFRNSAGTAVSRDFTYTATGYGREIV